MNTTAYLPTRSPAHPLTLILITGVSGAGKGLATRHFEDFGFYCVDNLPPALIPDFARECQRGGVSKAAIVCDVRGREFFADLDGALERLQETGVAPRVLFLDADDDLLLTRFQETRRRHPLDDEHPDLARALEAERILLAPIRERADKIVNTSHCTPRELREEIRRTFVDSPDEGRTTIRVQSFGFKHGAPNDSDLLFDVRFLPNPNYDRAIRHLDGTDQPVIDYVMGEELTQEFLAKWWDFISFCTPQFEREGKAYATIAVGCTGGRHRSVALTNWLTGRLRDAGYNASAFHRDLGRSAKEARNFVGPPAEDGAGARPSVEAGFGSADAASASDAMEPVGNGTEAL